MAIRIEATVIGKEELWRTLDAISPELRGRVVRRSLVELAGDLRRTAITQFLSGPPPQKLARRTGRTQRSMVIDRSGLSRGYIEVGTLADLWWLENYELGKGQRGKRAFMRPALKVIEPTIDDVFRRHWGEEIKRA